MSKLIWVDEIGEVTLSKRRSARSLRLRVTANGEVHVSLPKWLPYNSGVYFVEKKKSWILEQKSKNQKIIIKHGSQIGKTYSLYFEVTDKTDSVKTKIVGQKIIVSSSLDFNSHAVQTKAISACERALKKEAETTLPSQLQLIAKQYGFSYKNLVIRKLTSRWGSCSSHKIITLSYFMVQLPDELINYVILHELVHTQHLNHSRDFWHKLEELVPDARRKRKLLHAHKLRLEPL